MLQDYQITKFMMIFGLGNWDLILHMAAGHKVIIIKKTLIHTVIKENLRRLRPQAKIRLWYYPSKLNREYMCLSSDITLSNNFLGSFLSNFKTSTELFWNAINSYWSNNLRNQNCTLNLYTLLICQALQIINDSRTISPTCFTQLSLYVYAYTFNPLTLKKGYLSRR